MDDPADKPERRSGTYYVPGAFWYFIIYIYTTASYDMQEDTAGQFYSGTVHVCRCVFAYTCLY